jgi:hypothetical protein
LGLIVLLSTLLLAAVLWSAGRSRRVVRDRKPGRYAHLIGKVFGTPSAGVHVLAILPLRTDCHDPTVRYLLDTAEALPEQFHLRFLDRRSPEGEKELERRGLECAGVLVNDKTAFQVPDGREVKLIGGPDDAFSLEDLREILQIAFRKAYGDQAPLLPQAGREPAGPEEAAAEGGMTL